MWSRTCESERYGFGGEKRMWLLVKPDGSQSSPGQCSRWSTPHDVGSGLEVEDFHFVLRLPAQNSFQRAADNDNVIVKRTVIAFDEFATV